MREFIITSDQMKMLAESVGYFVDEPIGEVVIGGETLPDAGELRTENAKLREHIADLWEFGFSKNAGANSVKEYLRKVDELRDRTYELLGVTA